MSEESKVALEPPAEINPIEYLRNSMRHILQLERDDVFPLRVKKLLESVLLLPREQQISTSLDSIVESLFVVAAENRLFIEEESYAAIIPLFLTRRNNASIVLKYLNSELVRPISSEREVRMSELKRTFELFMITFKSLKGYSDSGYRLTAEIGNTVRHCLELCPQFSPLIYAESQTQEAMDKVLAQIAYVCSSQIPKGCVSYLIDRALKSEEAHGREIVGTLGARYLPQLERAIKPLGERQSHHLGLLAYCGADEAQLAGTMLKDLPQTTEW